MPFEPKTWVSDEDVTSTELNRIETGIADVDTALEGKADQSVVETMQPAGDYATAAQVASFPVVCIWNGTAWQTLAGDAVPTDPALMRWYLSTPYDTGGVATPTHYSSFDLWLRKPV